MSNSYHNLALDGVVTAIRALALSGLPDAQVYKRTLPSKNNVTLPAVIVSLAPLAETLDPQGESANTDDIGYPCAVTILVGNNQDQTVSDSDLYWRQRIAGEFHWRSPTALTSAINGTGRIFRYSVVEFGTIVDLELFRHVNLWASTFVVRVFVRKSRP